MKKLLLTLSFITPFIVNAISIRELLDTNDINKFKNYHGNENYSLDFSIRSITSLDGLQDLPDKEKLIKLYLSNNEITELEEDYFNGFINLRELWLNSNQITNTNNVFNNLKNLEVLVLNNNKINNIDYTFTYLINLEVINLSNNVIFFIDESAFDSLTKLIKLDLSKNFLDTISFDLDILIQNNQNLNGDFLEIQRNYLTANDIEYLNRVIPNADYSIRRQYSLEKEDHRIRYEENLIEYNLYNLKFSE